MMNVKIIAKKSGFTLLELAVVLAVIGIFIGAAAHMLTVNTRIEKNTITEARAQAIATALQAFRIRNDRLPCPANLTDTRADASFGKEQVSGTCTGSAPIPDFNNTAGGGETAAGAVPTQALHLPDEYMFDAWGQRFTYAVDRRAAVANAFTPPGGYDAQNTLIGNIEVRDVVDVQRTSNAIAVLVSHGENGHGSFGPGGTRKSVGSSNAREQTNCHCASDGATQAFSALFYQQPARENAASSSDVFDDLVWYYKRSAFLSEAERRVP